jgi:hypothetical protein
VPDLARKLCLCSGDPSEAAMSESRDQARVQAVDPDRATGAIRLLFAEISAQFALVPNLFWVFVNAPVALE